MAFRVKHIDHVEVVVRSIPAAEKWYGKVLGLKRFQSWDPEPVMIGAGNTMLALFQAPRAKGRPGKARVPRDRVGYLRVAFLTGRAGFEKAQKRLRKLGIPFRGPVDHGSAYSIYFRDPDGLPLEITRPVRG